MIQRRQTYVPRKIEAGGPSARFRVLMKFIGGEGLRKLYGSRFFKPESARQTLRDESHLEHEALLGIQDQRLRWGDAKTGRVEHLHVGHESVRRSPQVHPSIAHKTHASQHLQTMSTRYEDIPPGLRSFPTVAAGSTLQYALLWHHLLRPGTSRAASSSNMQQEISVEENCMQGE